MQWRNTSLITKLTGQSWKCCVTQKAFMLQVFLSFILCLVLSPGHIPHQLFQFCKSANDLSISYNTPLMFLCGWLGVGWGQELPRQSFYTLQIQPISFSRLVFGDWSNDLAPNFCSFKGSCVPACLPAYGYFIYQYKIGGKKSYLKCKFQEA